MISCLGITTVIEVESKPRYPNPTLGISRGVWQFFLGFLWLLPNLNDYSIWCWIPTNIAMEWHQTTRNSVAENGILLIRLSESREKDDYPGLPVIHLTDIETPNDLLWVGSSTKACIPAKVVACVNHKNSPDPQSGPEIARAYIYGIKMLHIIVYIYKTM